MKHFILDTNVILHDFNCLENFAEHNVYLPMAVLEELDNFKKGTEQKNYNARTFIRKLYDLTSDGTDMFFKGKSLGSKKGKLFFLNNRSSKEVREAFPERTPDNRILEDVFVLTKAKRSDVVLISKDFNLCIKARMLGLQAEDYFNDKIRDPQPFENAQPVIGASRVTVGRLFEVKMIDPQELGDSAGQITPNGSFILKSDNSSALAFFDIQSEKVCQVNKQQLKAFGIVARNAEQTFALNVLLRESLPLVALTGKAGTGKTLLALAAALEQGRAYHQILLARPIVSLSNKELGFLPGDEKDKIRPYMQPLYDNLEVIRNNLNDSQLSHLKMMQDENRLTIEALAFIRGRSLNRTFMIVDEAQNLTPHEVKTIITRAGEGTKIVFTGDVFQIDHPYLDQFSNGLAYLIERMKDQPLFAHVNLIKGERSALSELAGNIL